MVRLKLPQLLKLGSMVVYEHEYPVARSKFKIDPDKDLYYCYSHNRDDSWYFSTRVLKTTKKNNSCRY